MQRNFLRYSVRLSLAILLLVLGASSVHADDPPGTGLPVLGGFEQQGDTTAEQSQANALVSPEPVRGEGPAARGPVEKPAVTEKTENAPEPQFGGTRKFKAKTKKFQAPNEPKKPLREQQAESATGFVGAYAAWATDSGGIVRTTFTKGQIVRYGGQISNTTGGTQTAFAQWFRSSPCGGTTLWQGWLSVPAGTPWWYIESLASCVGTHNFTFSVTFNNTTTTRSYSYTVKKPGKVVARYAWMMDGGGTAGSNFVQGQTIRYGGQVKNTTGATRSAFLKWIDSSPCGGTTLWQGWIDIPTGAPWWYIESSANCVGAHTFTFSVTYNNATTTRTFGYTVTGASVTALYAWTMDNAGVSRNVFYNGQVMRYGGQVRNTTGGTQSAYVKWFRNAPCGETVLWEGWLSIPDGTPWWYMEALAFCPGTHTYTFYVTQNNVTTSRSYVYQVY